MNELQTNDPNSNLDLIRKTVAKDCNEQELKLFLYQSKRTGLDPLTRQIYAIKNKDKLIIQTSIDGFRLIAERSGKYAGQLGPFFCGSDGIWADVWLSKTPPLASKVGVLRSDFKEPLYAVAKFESYAVKNYKGELTYAWHKMPEIMLAKCAEALALRKAFPQELSGIYSAEEIQPEPIDPPPVEKPEIPIGINPKPSKPEPIIDESLKTPINEQQKMIIRELAKSKGYDDPKLKLLIKNKFNLKTGEKLNLKQYEDLKSALLDMKPEVTQ